MKRSEALRLLGLDDDATAEDIKVAYKETVQILHPDRFASNKKLQNRATEQFKALQEAYDYLQEHPAEEAPKRGRSRRASATERELEARLAGIQAARTQLMAERDALLDSRRNGLILIVGGAIVAIALRRIIPVAAIASTCIVWGIVQSISVWGNLKTMNDHLSSLAKEKNEILRELDDLD